MKVVLASFIFMLKNKEVLKSWKVGLLNSGIPQEPYVNSYLNYINILLNNDVPIIFEFNHLARLLGRKPSYLASVINSSTNHYREFSIPKKKGGKRIIHAPYPALFECQLWIYHNILKKIKIHPTAHAFTLSKSIITNASLHLNKRYLLKVDIEDFFPSIKINRIINIFKNLGYSNNVSFYLAQLCCCGEEIPQGAPTSPSLSNIVCRKLDKRFLGLAKKCHYRYTRYADDIAFSGEDISPNFINLVESILSSEGFKINKSKTVLLEESKRKILTGILVNGKTPRVPKSYKRKLIQEVYYIEKYGIFSHISKKRINNPCYIESLLGKLQFLLSVEPENQFAINSLKSIKSIKKGLTINYTFD